MTAWGVAVTKVPGECLDEDARMARRSSSRSRDEQGRRRLRNKTLLREQTSAMIENVERLSVGDSLHALVLGVIESSDLLEVRVATDDADHGDEETEERLQHDVQREESSEALVHETKEGAVLSGREGSVHEREESQDHQRARHGARDGSHDAGREQQASG